MAQTTVATKPRLGDVVIIRRDSYPASTRNGVALRAVIRATTIGTVLDGSGPLIKVDFGETIGAAWLYPDDLEVMSISDDLPEVNLGESLLACTNSQRLIIMDLQAKVDRLVRLARDHETALETVAGQRDEALAANVGLTEQLEALRREVEDLVNAAVYRAPSKLSPAIRALLGSHGWALVENFDSQGTVIEVTWRRTETKNAEGDQP